MGNETQLTASVILNPQRNFAHGDVLHHGDGLVGAHLGHGEGGGLVAVDACAEVDRDSVMFTTFRANLGVSALKY